MILLLALLCSSAFAAPLSKIMVDMTYTFDETTLYYPTMNKFEMNTLMNGTNENGIWMQFEEYSSGIHVGTHMDAPAHFAKGGLTIDQIPVSRLIAPAAVVDITAKAKLDRDAEATIEDLLHWEKITGQSLNGTVLLLRTGWGQKWGNRTDFLGTDGFDPIELRCPALAPESAQWLIDNREIFGLGVESVSIDRGIKLNGDRPVHQTLLKHGLYAIENMANMDKIPIYGAILHVMPMKIGNASGAPTRIVAVFPEVIFDRYSRNTGKDSENCFSTGI